MKGEVVGRVTGDSRSHKFVFSVNPLNQPSLYEYVYVEVQEAPPGEDGLKTVPVLAQVVDVKRVGVAVSPDHPWSVIKDVPDRGVQDLVVATARVLGYKHGDRIYYPRRPPQVGSWVYRAPDGMVSQFYSVPAKRALHLGYLISRPSVPVYLDLAGLERHLAIIAATGGGKTWTSIVLIEELVKKGATVLVLDPHGEYVKLRDSIHKLGPQYRSRVLVVKGHRSQEGDVLYRISVGSLDGEELASVAGVPPHATRVRAVIASARDIAGLLAKATGSKRYCSVKGVIAIVEAALASAARFRSAGSKASWELLVQGFVRELEASLTELAGRLLEPEYKKGLWACLWRLTLAIRREVDPAYDALRYLGELAKIGVYGSRTLPLASMLRPAYVTVFNLSGLRSEVQDHLVSNVLTRVFNARVRAVRGLEGEKLRYPVVVVLEEAHRFAPPKHLADTWSYWVIRKIASEGRKFGVYLVVITQRPSKVDSDVLSQCQSQIILRIVNPRDQEAVREAGEQVSQEVLDDLPGLNPGEAVVLGPVTPAPIMVRVRDRVLDYAGAGVAPHEEWREAAVEAAREARIEEALALSLSRRLGERVRPGRMLRSALSEILGSGRPVPLGTYVKALRLLAEGSVRPRKVGSALLVQVRGSEVLLDVEGAEWRCSCGRSCGRSPCHHVVAALMGYLLEE